MLTLKWPLTTRHFSFSGRHLGFSVDDILSLNIAFRSRTIFRKSHKHTPLYISLFQKYAGESDLGVILPLPPLDIEGLKGHGTLVQYPLASIRMQNLRFVSSSFLEILGKSQNSKIRHVTQATLPCVLILYFLN